jgi:hypothetical protein
MPLGQPPLPAGTIAVIRQWIANGALPEAASQVDVMPMQIRAIAPSPGESVPASHAEILLQADGELSLATVNPQSVELVRSGGDGSFEEGNEVRMAPVHVEVRSLAPTVLAISLADGSWIADTYRLTLPGDSAAPVRDSEGIPAARISLQFSVGGAQ